MSVILELEARKQTALLERIAAVLEGFQQNGMPQTAEALPGGIPGPFEPGDIIKVYRLAAGQAR